MKQLYFFFLLLSFASVTAQNFTLVDSKVKTYPKKITAEKLAHKIAIDFNSDQDKVRAIFSWLSFNIRYDLNEFYNPKQKRIRFSYKNEADKQAKISAIKNNIATKTMLKRKGVCEGYAQAFAKICSLLKIQNQVIKGYVRNSSNDIGKIKTQTNHAWNAVKLNNKWLYIDATWAAGFVINGKWERNFNDYFFNIPKQKYLLTHYPENASWQPDIKKISLTTFFKQPIYATNFLKKGYKLLKPTNGILQVKKGTPINITLKNLNANQPIYCGFSNSNYAKKPKITITKNSTTISIIPPKRSKKLHLIINQQVMLDFLIKQY